MDLFSAWRIGENGTHFASRRVKKRQEFISKKSEGEVEEESSPMDFLGARGQRTAEKSTMPERGFLRPHENAEELVESMYCYPSYQAMKDYYGPRFEATQPNAATVLNAGKPQKQHYPKNPTQMACIPFERRGECERFEETGWCPFHHPYEDPNAVAVTPEERQWLEADNFVL